MNVSGIYKIQSKIKPERVYIGSAVNIKTRWCSHLSKMRKNIHDSKKLQSHYNKYGESDLVFSILLGCDKEVLLLNEQQFIDIYKPWFNSRKIAESNLGCRWSNETKKKIGLASKGNKYRLGQSPSKETRKKISESKKGSKQSIETRKKIADSHRGLNYKPMSEIARKNISAAQKGRTPWNKGKKTGQIVWNKGVKTGITPSSIFKKGSDPWNKGKKGVYSKETLQIMSNKKRKVA